MTTLREYITHASENKKAIPHFNISTLDMLYSVIDTAEKISTEIGYKIPIIIGLAEKERDWVGETTAVWAVRHNAVDIDYPLFINADHTYSVERAKSAIDAGYDSIVIDFADKPYEENVKLTKEVVDYRNSIGSKTLIEAELGYIGAGSQMRDSLPEGVSVETMTNPNEAVKFIADTGCDMLAPSVGNVHGIVRSGNPALDANRVRSLVEAIPSIPLVLHGGSGSTDADFKSVIDAGISTIHISSDLRVAYRSALQKSLSETTDLAPYKYLSPTMSAVSIVVERYIRLFWRIDK